MTCPAPSSAPDPAPAPLRTPFFFVTQQAKIQQDIKREEMEILVVERRKQIEIEEQEILRREKELEANIKRPADATRFRTETIADGERYAPHPPERAASFRMPLKNATHGPTADHVLARILSPFLHVFFKIGV